MSNTITFHRLFSSSVSNLNRDASGRPKHAYVGGKLRGRYSSQSCKHSARHEFENVMTEIGLAIRTKSIDILLSEALNNVEATQTEKEEITKRFVEVFIKADNDEKKSKSKSTEPADPENNTLLAFSKKEYAHFAEIFKAHKFNASEIFKIDTEKNKAVEIKREILKEMAIEQGLEAIDVALFGRMIAKATELNVEGALRASHAFTTHEIKIENDYFTAVADAVNGEVSRGAGMLGDNYYDSGVYYQCWTLDLDVLKRNMGDNQDTIDTVIKAITQVLLSGAYPAGRLNTFNSPAQLEYMQVVIQKGGQAISGDNAFINAIGGDDCDHVADSINRLEEVLNSRRGYFDFFGYKALVLFDARKNEQGITGSQGIDAVIRTLSAM